MSSCRFLVDECVPHALTRGLRRRLPDVSVLHVGEPDSPAKGTSDAELLEFCEQQHRLFITADKATVPDCVRLHIESGRHTWGVFVVGSDTSIGRVLDELMLVCEASKSREWVDVLCFLPMLG